LTSERRSVAKVDLKKDLGALYAASARHISTVDVPALPYLMIDGAGDPNTAPAYAQAVEVLFSVAYTAKFMVKKLAAAAVDYAVMPLEGLWWSEDMATFTTGDKSAWQWTLMILQPPFVEEATLRAAIDDVARRKNLPALERLRYEHWTEGLCAQVLHVGPFSPHRGTARRPHRPPPRDLPERHPPRAAGTLAHDHPATDDAGNLIGPRQP